jgi:uncharacterized protein with WD repeat
MNDITFIPAYSEEEKISNLKENLKVFSDLKKQINQSDDLKKEHVNLFLKRLGEVRVKNNTVEITDDQLLILINKLKIIKNK